jgi:hypothetical protein
MFDAILTVYGLMGHDTPNVFGCLKKARRLVPVEQLFQRAAAVAGFSSFLSCFLFDRELWTI